MKTKIFVGAIAGLIIAMSLFAITIISVPYFYPGTLDMRVIKLEYKPDEYFVVTDADQVFLQAISQLGNHIFFTSWDETHIDELIANNKTNNALYQNNYYRVSIAIGEPPGIAFTLMRVCPAGIVVSIALLITLVVYKAASTLRKGTAVHNA